MVTLFVDAAGGLFVQAIERLKHFVSRKALDGGLGQNKLRCSSMM